jgi:hypothetical protein
VRGASYGAMGALVLRFTRAAFGKRLTRCLSPRGSMARAYSGTIPIMCVPSQVPAHSPHISNTQISLFLLVG